MSLDTLKTARPEEQEVVPVDFHGELIEIPDDLSNLPEANLKGKDLEKYVNPESPDAEPLRIVLANLESNVDPLSREAAHNELAKNDDAESPRWRRFVKSVWHTMTREYQVVKQTNEKRDEILKSGNLFHHHGKSDELQRAAVVKRYSSEYGDKLIHEEAGETFVKLGAEEAKNDPAVAEIRSDILKLVEDFAKGDLDEESFEPAQDRMFEKWKEGGIAQQYIGEGKFLAHNLLAMARQAKAAYDAREGLENVDRDAELAAMLEKAEIITGEAKVGSNVEIGATLSERLAEKMRGKKWVNEGRLARVTSFFDNEVFIAAAMSGVMYGGKRIFGAAAAAILPGLGAGIVAGLRERRALIDERALLARRLDAGQEIDTTNADQVEIAETLYAAEKSTKLIEQLRNLYGENGELNFETRADLEAALKLQGEIRARFRVETAQGKEGKPARLIDYTEGDSETSGDRKFLLDMALAKLEADMERCFADPEAAVRLEINPDEEYRAMLEANTDVAMGLYSQETRDQDKAFNRKVWHRGLKRAVVTILTSSLVKEAIDVIGDAIRDPSAVFAQIKSFFARPSTASPIITPMGFAAPGGEGEGGPLDVTRIGGESGPLDVTRIGGESSGPLDVTQIGGESGPVDVTRIGGESGPLDVTQIGGESGSLDVTRIGGESGPLDVTQIGGELLSNGKTLEINENTKVTLPEGYSVAQGADKVTVTAPDGKTFGVDLDKNGFPNEKSLQDLRDNGFKIYDQEGSREGEPKVTHEKVTRSEFYENHKHEMVKIKNESWYHNNTGEYDLNELRLDNELRKDGTVLISVERMLGDDSFKGSEHVDWKEAAKDGKLKVYLSASEGTQARAFELPMSPDGRLIIENDHPARALFNEDGKFIGGFQQVSVKGGETESGATKIATLATVVGGDASKFNDVVTTPRIEETHHYTIVPPTEMEPLATGTPVEDRDDTIPVPLYARRRLGDPVTPADVQVPDTTPSPRALPPAPSSRELPPASDVGPNRVDADADNVASSPDAQTAAPNTADSRFSADPNSQRTPNAGPTFSSDRPGTPDNSSPNSRSGDSQKTKGMNEGTPYERGSTQYSEAERAAFEKIAKIKFNMPSGFIANLDSLDALSRNIAISLMLEVLKNTPRGRAKPGSNGGPEPLAAYRARAAASMQARAAAMIGQLGVVSPTARVIFNNAFNAVLTVIPEPPRRPRPPRRP